MCISAKIREKQVLNAVIRPSDERRKNSDKKLRYLRFRSQI
nr:MAG TPA: hypothetical protein [Caudoviricetes sp.]